jgi:hypothetical protein
MIVRVAGNKFLSPMELSYQPATAATALDDA